MNDARGFAPEDDTVTLPRYRKIIDENAVTIEFPLMELPRRRSDPPPVARHRQPQRGHRWETWRHRLFVTVLVGLGVWVLYGVQTLLWPHNAPLSGLWSEVWGWGALLWTIGAFPAACELAGLFMWRAPSSPPRRIPQTVCWRIVSRGINTEALSDTIAACRREMQATPLFPYMIEVVVDSNGALEGLPPQGGDLHYVVVPKGYSTPGGTVFKARALNHALHRSSLEPRGWIVHLDEESHPTHSGIVGIAAMIAEEERDNTDRPRVGQGTITYHRDWKAHPFFTLSDCIRSGSDKGRLYLSMRVGVPLFGLHGSFIVIRNDVEKAVGFDVGPIGSLTEDAWWGTLAMEQGVRCRWVEGHIAEQCTQKLPDFLQQRRRWFNGMGRTALRSPAALRWRFSLLLSMGAWASAPVAWIYTVAHLFEGGSINPAVRLLANFSLAVYVATTLIGLQLNLREHGVTHYGRKIGWALLWLVCLPLFSLMEAVAVTYAMIRPVSMFHVVKK